MIKLHPLFNYMAMSAVVIVSPLLLFQNCSQFSDPTADTGHSSIASSAAADPNHVPAEALAPPSKQIRIANRRYMLEVFKDVFTSTSPDGVEIAPQLEIMLFHWIEKRGAQMGGACDTNDSLTLQDCNEDPASANLAIHSDSNAVRESFKIQMCEELLGTSGGFKIAVKNAGFDIANLPDANFDKIKMVYQLFYRTDEAPAYFLQTLSQLYSDLRTQGENTESSWRGLFLVICESPEWELL